MDMEILQEALKQKTPTGITCKGSNRKTCCRGRVRTFTGQLAIIQSSVVDPGRPGIATKAALYYVYPVIPTSETRRHVCQKFHHPTMLRT
jgi:hypothetical protein